MKVKLNYEEIESTNNYFTIYPNIVLKLKNDEKTDGYITISNEEDECTKEVLFYIHPKHLFFGSLPLQVDKKYIKEIIK